MEPADLWVRRPFQTVPLAASRLGGSPSLVGIVAKTRLLRDACT